MSLPKKWPRNRPLMLCGPGSYLAILYGVVYYPNTPGDIERPPLAPLTLFISSTFLLYPPPFKQVWPYCSAPTLFISIYNGNGTATTSGKSRFRGKTVVRRVGGTPRAFRVGAGGGPLSSPYACVCTHIPLGGLPI
jgi:hypothetical protein